MGTWDEDYKSPWTEQFAPSEGTEDNLTSLARVRQQWNTIPLWKQNSLKSDYPELFAPPVPTGPKPNKSKGWLSRLGGKLADWAGNSWGTVVDALALPADVTERAIGFLPSYLYWNDVPDGYSRWDLAGLMYDVTAKAIVGGRHDARQMVDRIQRDMDAGMSWQKIMEENQQTWADVAWKVVADPLWLVGGVGWAAKAPGKLARLVPGGKALLGFEKSGLLAARAGSEVKLGQATLIAADEGLARLAAEGIGKESPEFLRLSMAKTQALADIAKAGPIAKANKIGAIGNMIEWGIIGGGEAPINLWKGAKFVGLTEKNIPVVSRTLRIGRAMLGGKPYERQMEDIIANVAHSHASRALAITEGRASGPLGGMVNWMMRKNLILNKAFRATSAMQEFERFGMSLAHDPTMTPLDYAMTWGALMDGREGLAKLEPALLAKLPQEYLDSPVTDEMSKILQTGLDLKKWPSLKDPDQTTLGARFLDDALFGKDGKTGAVSKLVRDYFGMANPDPITRLQGHVKSFISMTTLNRPAFVILNAVNNLATVAWHEGPDMFRAGITKKGMLKDLEAATGMSGDHIANHIIEGGLRKLLYGSEPKNPLIRGILTPFISAASEMDAWARIKAWQLGRRRGMAAAANRLWTRPDVFHLLDDELQGRVEGIRLAMAGGAAPYEMMVDARKALDAGYMPEFGHGVLHQYLGERYGEYLGQLPLEQRDTVIDLLAEPFHDFAGTLTDIRNRFPGFPELAKTEFDNWVGSVKYENYRLHLDGGLPPINEAETSTGEMLAGIAIDEHRMGLERTNRTYATLRAAGVPEHVAEEFRAYQAGVYNDLFATRQSLGTASPAEEMVSQAVELNNKRRALKSLVGNGEIHEQDIAALREMGYDIDDAGILADRTELARAERELEDVYTTERINGAKVEDAARAAKPAPAVEKKVTTKQWQTYFATRKQALMDIHTKLEAILDTHARDKLPLFNKLQRRYMQAIEFHDKELPAAMRRGENVKLGADMGPTRKEINKRFVAVARDLEKQLPLPRTAEYGFAAADNMVSMAEAQTLSNQVGVDFMHWAEPRLMEDIANPKVLAADVRESMIKWVEELHGTAKDVEIAGNLTGHAAADYIMLNYNRVGNLDTWSMWAIPYLFWPTRSMERWAQRMFANPGLMAMLAKTRDMTQELNENLPVRLRYQMKIPFPGIGDLMNKFGGPNIPGNLYFDPLKIMFPFMQWSEDFSPEGRKGTLFGQVLDWWGNNGPGVSPFVPLIGSAVGALDKEAWLTRTWPNSLPFGIPGTPAQMAVFAWIAGDEKVPINNFLSEDEQRKLLIGAGLPLVSVQRLLGMEDDRFDKYRVDRAMQDVLLLKLKDVTDPAEKQRIVSDYLHAMWNQDPNDPLWQEARVVASKEMGIRTLTSWLFMPISIYPEGEMLAKSLQPLYADAARNDRLEEFFARFPEFRVRQVAQASYTSEAERTEELGTTLYYMDMATAQATLDQTYRERDLKMKAINDDPKYFNTKLGRWYRDMITEEYAARVRDDREAINQIVGLYGERPLSYNKAPKTRAMMMLANEYWDKSLDSFLPAGLTMETATDQQVNDAVTALSDWRERFILQLPAERLDPEAALEATIAYYGEALKARRLIAEGADYDKTWDAAHAAQDEFTAIIKPNISRAEFQTYLERNLEPPSKTQIKWEEAQKEMAQYTFVRDELKWPKTMLAEWWDSKPILAEFFGNEPDPYEDALPGWAWNAYAQVMRIRDDYYGKPSTVQLDYLSLVKDELNYYLDQLGLPVVQLEQGQNRLWDVTLSPNDIAIQ